MGNQNNYFILGGVIAFSLFAFFVSLFLFMLFRDLHKPTYALKKENYISISLVTPQESSPKEKTSLTKPHSVVEQKIAPKVKQAVDVNDLFADVWTRDVSTLKKRKVNAKRLGEIAKAVAKVEKNKVEPLTKAKPKEAQKDQTKALKKSSSGEEVNEYLAKIQATVYRYFHVPPNTEGNSVECVIELDAMGRVLDFRVLRYSASEALNQEVERMKERLKNVIFPKNPENRSSRTVVVLISKE